LGAPSDWCRLRASAAGESAAPALLSVARARPRVGLPYSPKPLSATRSGLSSPTKPRWGGTPWSAPPSSPKRCSPAWPAWRSVLSEAAQNGDDGPGTGGQGPAAGRLCSFWFGCLWLGCLRLASRRSRKKRVCVWARAVADARADVGKLWPLAPGSRRARRSRGDGSRRDAGVSVGGG